MNSEAMQKPIANERADDANCRVADETEPASSDDLAREPSGNDPDDQNYNQSLVRQMHTLPCPVVLIRCQSHTLQRIWAGNTGESRHARGRGCQLSSCSTGRSIAPTARMIRLGGEAPYGRSKLLG